MFEPTLKMLVDFHRHTSPEQLKNAQIYPLSRCLETFFLCNNGVYTLDQACPTTYGRLKLAYKEK